MCIQFYESGRIAAIVKSATDLDIVFSVEEEFGLLGLHLDSNIARLSHVSVGGVDQVHFFGIWRDHVAWAVNHGIIVLLPCWQIGIHSWIERDVVLEDFSRCGIADIHTAGNSDCLQFPGGILVCGVLVEIVVRVEVLSGHIESEVQHPHGSLEHRDDLKDTLDNLEALTLSTIDVISNIEHVVF